MARRWDTRKVSGREMGVYVSEPPASGMRPGIVVIQEAFGVNQHIQNVTDRAAAAGYVAVAPDLYYRDGPRIAFGYGDKDIEAAIKIMGNLRDDDLITDLNSTIELLSKHPQVQGGDIGMVGFCVGGRITYLGATSCPSLRAGVVYYGGRIPVPFGDGPSPLERTTNIACPIMGNFGQLDTSPSPEEVGRIEAELKKHSKTYVFKIYPGANHGFNCDERGSFHPEAAQDAWARTLNFFAKHLKPTA